MEIEKVATSVVTNYFSKMDNISPFISEGDKEPSWDGHLYVYKSTTGKKQNYKKEDVICRIPVQVKGDTCKGTVKDHSISYPVETADLRNYKNHGVAYFVVRIDHNGTETIYYDLLCPVDIARLLDETKSKKTLNVEFNKLSQTRDIYSVLINFDNDRNKQTSFVSMPNFKPIDIDEIISTGVMVEAKMVGGHNSFFDFVKYSTSNPIYLYSKPANPNYPPMPIDKAMLQYNLEPNEPVSVCDTVFFDNHRITFCESGILYTIGHTVTLRDNYHNEGQLKYTLKGTVQQVIDTLVFLIELGEKGKLSIGDYTIDIPIFEASINNGNKQLLMEMQELNIIAKHLGIENELIVDFSQIDDQARLLLNILTKVIINKEQYKNDGWTNAQKIGVKLCNTYLPLLFCQDQNEKSTNVYNILANDKFGCLRYVGDTIEMNLPVSYILEKRDFESLNPIYHNRIYDELTQYSGNPPLVERTNIITLHMLSAYDITKSAELLSLCNRMTEWLFAEDSLPYDIRLANKLQTIRRERMLDASEKKLVKQQIKKTTDNSMLAALYLLIDSKPKAREYYNKLSTADKKTFRSYPIHTLMKKNF